MAEYTRQDMERMQKEAENRVRNMQQRAQQNLNWENFGHSPLPSSRNPQNQKYYNQSENQYQMEEEHDHEPDFRNRQEEQHEKHFPGPSLSFPNLFGGPLKFLENLNLKELLHDSDTALIAAILLLVCRKESDPMLTLALIYIML